MAEERQFIFKNFSRSTLGAALSSSATSLRVETNHGDRFPSPGSPDIYEPDQIFAIILTSGSRYEIVYCTARAGDLLTVERGREGTTAQEFPVGANVVHQMTAAVFEQAGTLPLPVITSLDPESQLDDEGAFTLGITGTGFVPSSVAEWEGSPRDTVYINSTTLEVDILAGDVDDPGEFDVTVTNPAPGGGESNAEVFTVEYPVPVITSLDPESQVEDEGAFTLEVTGTGFYPASVVEWEGSPRDTVYINSTTLEADIEATDVDDVGEFDVTVVNPTPGGGTSSAAVFEVTDSAPSLASVSPNPLGAGFDYVITVTGTNFVDGVSVVRIDGVNLATTFVSPTSLTAVLPAASIPTADTYDIDVNNPGVGDSNDVVLTAYTMWTPADTTTQFWFDADDSGTITITGSGISQWADKSGNARHVLQATDANRPVVLANNLNSRDVVDYDGLKTLRTTTGLTGLAQNIGELSVFSAHKFDDVGGSTFWIVYAVGDNSVSGGNSDRLIRSVSTASDSDNVSGKRLDADAMVGTGISTDTNWHTTSVAVDYTNAVMNVYKDGTIGTPSNPFQTAGSTSNTAPAALSIGGPTNGATTLAMVGKIAEVFALHSVDATLRQKSEGYLAWRWGLVANLDVGHLYKTVPPPV